MGRRMVFRQGDGRFRRSSLTRDFGIRALWCVACRGGNPIGVWEDRPETCRHCGKPFVDIGDIVHCDKCGTDHSENQGCLQPKET